MGPASPGRQLYARLTHANFGCTACSPISRARSVLGHSSSSPSRPEPTRMHGVDGEAGHVAVERRRRALDHAAHHIGREDTGERIERAVDRDHRAALRHRRELADHRRTDHVDRAAQPGADHQQRDHQPARRDMRQHREDRTAEDQRRGTEHAARAAGREATRQHHLRDPAGEDHDDRAEHPGQDRDEAGLLLREAKPLDDERREPGEAQRQRPIGAEGRGARSR